tara:strand:+ start:16235 stop:16648 length:414 start_codon:yes stop_codon:yes gene_type:complete
MQTFQKEIILPIYKRGIYLITDVIDNAIKETNCSGLLNIFIQHTSASITINENSDPTVRQDLELYFDKLVPESEPYYKHVLEGPDDMPAHIKASLFGNSLTIPITDGKLNMGVWQGIYLCEHRNQAPNRKLVITIIT